MERELSSEGVGERGRLLTAALFSHTPTLSPQTLILNLTINLSLTPTPTLAVALAVTQTLTFTRTTTILLPLTYRQVLDEAISLIEMHKAHVAGEGSSERKRQQFDRKWAAELSDCYQGLALARLIFNTGREEDELIEELLQADPLHHPFSSTSTSPSSPLHSPSPLTLSPHSSPISSSSALTLTVYPYPHPLNFPPLPFSSAPLNSPRLPLPPSSPVICLICFPFFTTLAPPPGLASSHVAASPFTSSPPVPACLLLATPPFDRFRRHSSTASV